LAMIGPAIALVWAAGDVMRRWAVPRPAVAAALGPATKRGGVREGRTRAPARKPAAKSAAAKPAGRKRAAGSSKR